MTELTKRQRKRAKQELRRQELLAMRAAVVLLHGGKLPEYFRGLNRDQTRKHLAALENSQALRTT
jgi:hypothetical protein